MLYINYGVPKSGSTLTFEMTRQLLELAGHQQFSLSADVRNDRTGRTYYTNTVRDWTPEVVSALESAAPAGSILLVRTHHPATEAVSGLIASGGAKHMVGLRDPRDVALSMLDVVTRLTEKGRSHNVMKSGQLDSTFAAIDWNVAQSTAWADIPGALMLDYERTAFSHESAMDAICEQLGLPPSQHLYPAAFETATVRMEPKKNVARPYRHRREMSVEGQQMFLDRYADYYARFYPNAGVLVEDDDDDERELALLAERRERQRQRVADRNARIEARAQGAASQDRDLIRKQRHREREERQRAQHERHATPRVSRDTSFAEPAG